MWCTGCSHIVCTTCTLSVLQVDHCVTADTHQDWGLSRQCCTACQVVSEQRKGEAVYPVSQLGMIILQTTLYNLETLICVLYLRIDTFLNHFIYSQFACPYYLKRLPTLCFLTLSFLQEAQLNAVKYLPPGYDCTPTKVHTHQLVDDCKIMNHCFLLLQQRSVHCRLKDCLLPVLMLLLQRTRLHQAKSE